MTVRPIQTDVGWAVDMDATAETVRIANVGKNGHSVGQVTMQLNISAGNFLRRHNTKITYSCQGDGKLRYVNGLEGVSPAQD